jgi:hypothetical protein
MKSPNTNRTMRRASTGAPAVTPTTGSVAAPQTDAIDHWGTGAHARTAAPGSAARAAGERPRPRLGRLGFFLIAWLALAVVAVSWAMATPLGGSPDEPAHIVKAASVVRGQLLGAPTAEPAVTTVQVPRSLSDATTAWPCYRRDSTAEATCMPPFLQGARETDAPTSAGLYNPVYYALVGWPSLLVDDAETIVYGMRIVSALLTTALLALAFTVLSSTRRSPLVGIGLLAAATPMVLFLAGAVNPNGLEIAAGASLFALLAGIVNAPAKPSWATLLGVVVSGVLLANARGLSPLWMALIGLVVILAAPAGRIPALLRTPRVLVALAGLALAGVGAAAWQLQTGSLGAMGTFGGAGGAVSPPEAFLEVLLNQSIDPGLVGWFGWLDAMAPGFVLALWSVLALGLVVVALAMVRGRALAALLVAIAVVLFVPPLVQAASIENSGYIWQGRYALVAFVCLVLLAALLTANRVPPVAPLGRLLVPIAVLVVVGQVLSLATATKRFAVGLDKSWADLFTDPSWQPPGGCVVWLAVCGLGSVALTALVAVVHGRALPAGARNYGRDVNGV